MSYFMRTIQNPKHRKHLFDRLARLDPAQPPLWGRLRAPKMLAHLCDQMRMPYNDPMVRDSSTAMCHVILSELSF